MPVAWAHSLPDADPSCGGKAVHLAQLIAAALPVPEGFVIDHRAFDRVVRDGHEVPDELRREVDARAARLGLLAVRSSATIEDSDLGAAAGVFSSRRAVPPGELWPAIGAVWDSARSPEATAYARRRGASVTIGVIVQRHVAGAPITIYSRPPGRPSDDELWIQRDGTLTRHRRDDPDPLVALALAAEAALAVPGGVDVELIAGDRNWIVQARPIVHPSVAVQTPPPPAVLAPLAASRRVWTWDVAHNPDPLSTAQTELVDRVERAGFAPWSMQVCSGFLYTSPREPSMPAAPPGDPAELATRVAALEQRMEDALQGEVHRVDDAVGRYVAFYRIWAVEWGPLLAALRSQPSPRHGSRPASVEAALRAAARGELDDHALFERVGVLAPAWDVAVATFAERPSLLRDAVERARSIASLPAAPPDPIADLAERDDLWFARAQWLVRRALLARATELGLDAADVFWIAFDQLAQPIDLDRARRIANAARNAAQRAASWAMPIVVGEVPAIASRHQPLRGVGSGPRVSGRVVRFESLAAATVVGRADIVVTRAVTPALAVFVVGCAALISETGGPLDHGAALARELGIPYVVGCSNAWIALADGMLVTVDADAGVVEIAGSQR